MAIRVPSLGVSRERLTRQGSGVRTTAAQRTFLPEPRRDIPDALKTLEGKLTAIRDEMQQTSNQLVSAKFLTDYEFALQQRVLELDPDEYASWPDKIKSFSATQSEQVLAEARRKGLPEDVITRLSIRMESAGNTATIRATKDARSIEGTVTTARLDNLRGDLLRQTQGKPPDDAAVISAKQQYESALQAADRVLLSPKIVELRHKFNVAVEESWLDQLSPFEIHNLPDDAFQYTMKRDRYQAKALAEVRKVAGAFLDSPKKKKRPRIDHKAMSQDVVSRASWVYQQHQDQFINSDVNSEEEFGDAIDALADSRTNLSALLVDRYNDLTPAQITKYERQLAEHDNTLFIADVKQRISGAFQHSHLNEIAKDFSERLNESEGPNFLGRNVLKRFGSTLQNLMRKRSKQIQVHDEWMEVVDNPYLFKQDEISERYKASFEEYSADAARHLFDEEGHLNALILDSFVRDAKSFRVVADPVVSLLTNMILNRNDTPQADRERGNAARAVELLLDSANTPDIDGLFSGVVDYLPTNTIQRLPEDIGRSIRESLPDSDKPVNTGTASYIGKREALTEAASKANMMKIFEWREQGDTLLKSIGKKVKNWVWDPGAIEENNRGVIEQARADLSAIAQDILYRNPSLYPYEAFNKAAKIVGNTYRVSILTGDPKVMVNPPESPRFSHGGIEATADIQEQLIEFIRAHFNTRDAQWSEEARNAANALFMADPNLQTVRQPSHALRNVQVSYVGTGTDGKPQWSVKYFNRNIGRWAPRERYAAPSMHDTAWAAAGRGLSRIVDAVTTSRVPTRTHWLLDNLLPGGRGAPRGADKEAFETKHLDDLLSTDFSQHVTE